MSPGVSQIVRPFIVPVVWGIIIAIAVHPGHRRLETALGNRRTIAVAVFTLLMLILLIGPLASVEPPTVIHAHTQSH